MTLMHFYAIALWSTPYYPCINFKPSNVLHCSQGFLLPNLVAIGDFLTIWPLVDSGWPQLTPTEFGGHRAFLKNATSGWPRLTPAWPLTPAMSYTLIRGSSYQIWWPYIISEQFDRWLTLADPCMTVDPCNALRSDQGFFPINLVAIGHC